MFVKNAEFKTVKKEDQCHHQKENIIKRKQAGAEQ
jgi:hypothetical protein